MLNWLEEITNKEDFIEISTQNTNIMNTRAVRINPKENDRLTISSLSQFFIAPYVMISKNIHTEVPVNEISLPIIENELLPHFHDSKYVYNDDVLTGVILGNLNALSENLFNEQFEKKQLNPLIFDLYYYKEEPVRFRDFESIKEYKIIENSLENYISNEFNEYWEFMKISFLKGNNLILITPIGWILKDDLQNSLILRALSSSGAEVSLFVNEKLNTVLYIEVKIN
jgi:hypothetical protein